MLPFLDELRPSVAVGLMVKLKNMRAAEYHDEATSRDPVCRRAPLTHVTDVYGDELRDVYVELCRICGWSHLDTSSVLGSAASAAARGKRTTAAQQVGRA